MKKSRLKKRGIRKLDDEIYTGPMQRGPLFLVATPKFIKRLHGIDH